MPSTGISNLNVTLYSFFLLRPAWWRLFMVETCSCTSSKYTPIWTNRIVAFEFLIYLCWFQTATASQPRRIASPRRNTDFFFTFMGPCIVNVFKHNQQAAMLHRDIYYYKCSTCFRRFHRPYSFWAPDDGRRNRLKHVEHV